MKVKFTKMQGLGNDFVVFDATRRKIALSPATIRALADRHFGVGCDQVLVVEAPISPDADFGYRIFNADGGEVEQCGNGARCFVRFVHDHGLSAKREIQVDTISGRIAPRLELNGEVSVNMGPPIFEADRIPFVGGSDALTQILDVDGQAISLSILSMGNPHAVQVVEDVDRAPVATLGPLIEHHPNFPRRVNAGFMQVVKRDHVRLRVWERGAGETLACGTGACAAAVAGIRLGLLDGTVRVSTRGGDLTIRWNGGDNAEGVIRPKNNKAGDFGGLNANPVWMTGPAVTVFEGEIELDECR